MSKQAKAINNFFTIFTSIFEVKLKKLSRKSRAEKVLLQEKWQI
jgi:hypothetical protein